MKKRPWVKLWRKTIGDEKISFLIARHGHDVFTVWTFLLLSAEDYSGTVELDPEFFAFSCHVEEERLREILQILSHPRRALIQWDGEARVEILNWAEYQFTDSADRVRKLRERQRDEEENKEEEVTLQNDGCNADVTLHERYNPITTEEDVTPLLRPRVEGRGKRVDIQCASHTGEPAGSPEAAGGDHPLYREVWKTFLERNDGRFSDYGKEGKAVQGLIQKAKHRAREPTEVAPLLRQMVNRFWELKVRGNDRFWSAQPFLPSALNASGIFDRVLETFRVNPVSTGVEEVIRELEEHYDGRAGSAEVGGVLLPVSRNGP